MKLRPDTVLEGVAETLRDKIAPKLDDPFAANDLRMAQTLLAIVRLSREDEVALKVEENHRMREIFTDAACAVGDLGLAERLAKAGKSQDPGLRISELDDETRRLRELLVELHSHVDAREDDEDAKRIGQAIWRTLRDIEMPRAARA
jgi:hypothetical protein